MECEQLKAILSKPASERTDEDLAEIAKFIVGIQFFSKLREDQMLLNECCAYMTYEFFNRGDYIFHQGDFGEKFYVLIYGQASVLMPKGLSGHMGLQELFVYNSGSSFGELALINKKPRAATIQAKTSCHFAVLDKFNYQRILSNSMKKKQLETVEFLQKQPMFNNLTKASLAKLSYCFEEIKVAKDYVLFHEGSNINFIYFIKEGDVMLSKKLTIRKVGYDGFDKFKAQLNKNFSQRAGVSILGPGEFIGLYSQAKKNYSYTAVCKTNAVLLQISLIEFQKRVNGKEVFDKLLNGKEIIRDRSITSIQKVILDKEVTSFRKINMNLSIKCDGVSRMSPLSLSPNSMHRSRDTPASMIRNKFKAKLSNSSRYEIKITNKEQQTPLNRSLATPRKTFDFRPSVFDQKVCEINQVSVTASPLLNKSQVIMRLKPFGRTRSPKPRRPSNYPINIHTSSVKFLNTRSSRLHTLTHLSRSRLNA